MVVRSTATSNELAFSSVMIYRYDWPEKNLYGGDGKMDWKVLPFVHTFPGNDPDKTTWIEAHCADCPTITSFLKKIPGLRIALLSRLGPNTVLSAHQVRRRPSSWAKLGGVFIETACAGVGHLGKPRFEVPPTARSAHFGRRKLVCSGNSPIPRRREGLLEPPVFSSSVRRLWPGGGQPAAVPQ